MDKNMIAPEEGEPPGGLSVFGQPRIKGNVAPSKHSVTQASEDRIEDGLDMWYGKAQSNPEFPRRFVHRKYREAHSQILLRKRQRNA
jgi:hypothetical protein